MHTLRLRNCSSGLTPDLSLDLHVSDLPISHILECHSKVRSLHSESCECAKAASFAYCLLAVKNFQMSFDMFLRKI